MIPRWHAPKLFSAFVHGTILLDHMARPESSQQITRLQLLALTPAWLGILWIISKAQWFWSNRPDLQFGWIIPLLCLFLFFDRWNARPTGRFKLSAVSAVLALSGFVLLGFYQLVEATFGLVASGLLLLFAGVFSIAAANVHFVFGREGVRFFLFPFLFLLIALPIPSGPYNLIVSTLQSQITNLNVEILALLGIPAQKMGSLIQLPNGVVGVDEACSGIRSLQSTVMATLFIAAIMLDRKSLRIVLFFSGLFFAVLGNVLRSLFLSLTANAKGTEAIDAVHDSAGWSIFVFNAVAVALTAWLLVKFQNWLKRQPAAPTETIQSPAVCSSTQEQG